MSERRGQHCWRDDLTMMPVFKSTEGLDTDLKEGTVNIIESKKVVDKRAQRGQLQEEANR